MAKLKDRIVQIVGKNAADKIAELTSQLVRAAPQAKEEILAGIDFERWLAETCHECLQ